jgi:RNA polymerase sigma-70 factor (ECF subfamily)
MALGGLVPGPDPLSDDESLVSRIRSGDEGAARVLFAKYFPLLRARVRRRMSSRFRSKSSESDVIQEAYMAAFRRLAEFEDRGDGSFGRWLGGIVDNKFREEVRRHLGTEKRDVRRERGTVGSDAAPPATSRERSPSSAAMATEEMFTLVRAIERIPEQYRTVLHLLYEQGLSLKDAGERMNRSPDAVRMLYGRALAALAESMGRKGPGGPR